VSDASNDRAEAVDRRADRYDLLDACRGVACLMVVLHHAGFAVAFDATGGSGAGAALRRLATGSLWRMNLGVPLFFVISGYCIAASAEAVRRRGGGAGRFLLRRVWRIYPPYWASLLLFVAVTAGLDAAGLRHLHYGDGQHALQLDSPGELDWVQWVGNVTLTEGYRASAWSPPETRLFTRVSWSLCFEEQFYFLCFLSLMAPRGALAVVTALALGYRLMLEDVGRASALSGTFPMLWHEFAAGVAVYWVANRARTSGEKAAGGLFLVGLVAAWAAGYLRQTPTEFSTPVAAAFGLALILLRPWDGRLSRHPWLAPLRACGRRSYSIYLVHLPACTVGNLWLYERGLTGFWARVLVMVPLVSAAAVGLGWAFHAAVERHFLNPPTRARARAPRPSAGGPA
jgi:peptidoglycan/LPS O-acetylase OafA/YrhL